MNKLSIFEASITAFLKVWVGSTKTWSNMIYKVEATIWKYEMHESYSLHSRNLFWKLLLVDTIRCIYNTK
jgi:hypothetical protein